MPRRGRLRKAERAAQPEIGEAIHPPDFLPCV
jgi:hypothetical protein